MKSVNIKLDDALITFDGERLVANTGIMTRSWRWTGRGFLTTEIKAGETARGSLCHGDSRDADWLLPVVEGTNPEAELVSAEAVISDDEGFTSRHVRFRAALHYAEVRLAVRFDVWAYPQAPGIRVHLSVRALEGFTWDGTLDRLETTEKSLREARLGRGYQRLDILPMSFKGKRRRMIGYFSDTQNRNDPWLDILLEAEDAKPLDYPYVCEWSNALCVEDNAWGVAMVKESHKCVNQRGVDTGFFACDPEYGLESYGWGIRPSEIDQKWRPAWATWCLVYASDERSRLRAFKTFDRLRFPLTDRDIYIQANTWGSSQGSKQHRDAAGEENVLREIASCADLGIDVLQIDDGWQGDQCLEWNPIPPRYPNGWSAVRDAAKAAGVSLGLWMAAVPPTLDDMERNIQDGGFVSLKLDFAVLNNRQKIDDLMDKVRALVLGRSHQLRINWDVTEIDVRYGYFFAREFGCIYLENRKPEIPVTVVYRPGTVLRDLWQIARYCNLLKFQGSIQNIDSVNKRLSDAGAYHHAYCTAIALMSTPLFFCETHLYSEQARDEIRPLLAAYRKVRADIYRGVVHPIGETPDGASWTGFECELVDEKRGFFTLFREPGSEEKTYAYCLPHLAGRTLHLENLLDGACWTSVVGVDGRFEITIGKASDFRFLAYNVSISSVNSRCCKTD